ncbi:MAG: hypothetical protein OXR66_05065 [Candidatus Woesearchaeota archaeon]|nr:hypothetical protein [Candidatus Woesearchaeota archaeon]
MIIYNPHDHGLLSDRVEQAQVFFRELPKYAFISGSFLYQKKYNDIDMFIITRSTKKFQCEHATITLLDFNQLSSLFYHSITKHCVAKTVLPTSPVTVTLASYWDVVNETVPDLLNNKNTFRKTIRSLVLYTEFLRSGKILDTVQLQNAVQTFKTYKDVLQYVLHEVPPIMKKRGKASYLKRFFYAQAATYKSVEYDAQKFLYDVAHHITRGLHG